jgi:Cu/Ag efflux protein CusF
MSKTLVRYIMAVCVAVVALTVSQSVRAADEKAAATAAAKSIFLNGKIEAVDVKASTITIKHKKETKTFTVATDCKFTGAGDKKVTLADLAIGDQVKVTYTQEGDKSVAHHIGHVDLKKKTDEAPPAK